jgi:hypothetical protein
MATVLKSEHVRDQINHKINNLFNARREAARNSLGEWTPTQLGDYIYEALVTQEMRTLMLQVNNIHLLHPVHYDGSPVILYKMVDHISIRINREYREFPMSQARLLPQSLIADTGYGIEAEKYADKVGQVFEALQARKEAIAEVEKAVDALHLEFKRVWNAVPNLNQLVKLWPAAQQLLEGVTDKHGNNVLNRMQQKVVRTRTAPISIDTAALNAQLLMARLAE